MAGESFIRVPENIGDNPVALRRFLLALIEYLDIAFGNRGSNVADTFTAKQFLSTTEAAKLYTKNPQQTAISQLGITVSNPPTQAEMQEVVDKLDQVIVALTLSKII
jgi:hypothetical protein